MKSLIYKEDLIEALERLGWYHINNGRLVPGATSKDGLYKQEDIYRVVDEQPLITRQWIPCSERLPTEEKDYLVTLSNGYDRCTYVDTLIIPKNDDPFWLMSDQVVAWAEAPEPWKEDGNG